MTTTAEIRGLLAATMTPLGEWREIIAGLCTHVDNLSAKVIEQAGEITHWKGMAERVDLWDQTQKLGQLTADNEALHAELERVREDFRIAQMGKARQHRPDLCGDRIIPIAMPAQNELGLLPQVLETWHGRMEV